jgi:hypothetical protein
MMSPSPLAALRRALPHLIGMYAVIALLTGARFFQNTPTLYDFDVRLNLSVGMGTMWPIYWPTRVARDAYSHMRNAAEVR